MGLLNGKIRFIGDDKEDIAFKTVDKLFKRGTHSMVTLIFGEDVTEEEAARVEEKLKDKYKDDIEISVVNGAQPVYYYIISVE